MSYATFQKVSFRVYNFITKRMTLTLIYKSFCNLFHNIGEPMRGRRLTLPPSQKVSMSSSPHLNMLSHTGKRTLQLSGCWDGEIIQDYQSGPNLIIWVLSSRDPLLNGLKRWETRRERLETLEDQDCWWI